MKNEHLWNRFQFAVTGLKIAFKQEASFRTHILACVIVIGIMMYLQPSILWWAVVFLTICLVLVTELMNTAIETLADTLHPEIHPEIGKTKDIAAGAVLIASFIAILVAVLLALSLFTKN